MHKQFIYHILSITKYLDSALHGRIIIHMQDYHKYGFQYPQSNRFLSTNILPSQYKALKKILHADYVEYRFLCNTKCTSKTKNFPVFLNKLAQKNVAPTFVVIPYDLETESSYAVVPRFEIRIKLYKNKYGIKFYNYSENTGLYRAIMTNIKTLLSQKSAKAVTTNIPQFKNIAKKIDPKQLRHAIINTQQHMRQGDCYLANITTTINIPDHEFITPEQFINICYLNNNRFGIFYRDKHHGVACFSPERFLLRYKDILLAEPIKGTIKFSRNHAHQAAQSIWNNKKEIHENTLVTDLLRNDLNMVCIPGSVTVYQAFFARVHTYLIQMQSFILGKIKASTDIVTCLQNMLPAGSISGTPKKRVCEIIANQEAHTRGYYTGVCGIIEPSGNFDLTLLIRSIFRSKRGTYTGVGAGITTLSKAQDEINEIKIKLQSFTQNRNEKNANGR